MQCTRPSCSQPVFFVVFAEFGSKLLIYITNNLVRYYAKKDNYRRSFDWLRLHAIRILAYATRMAR